MTAPSPPIRRAPRLTPYARMPTIRKATASAPWPTSTARSSCRRKPTFLQLRGTLKLQDGDVDGALRDAEAVLKGDRQQRGGLGAARVGVCPQETIRPRARRSSTARSSAIPRTRWPIANAAQVYLAKSDNDHALADLSRAIALGSTGAALYRARAAIYTPKAIPIWRSPTSTRRCRASRTDVGSLIDRAQIKQARGETAAAMADFDAVLTRDPKNVAALGARAAALIRSSNFEQGDRRPRSRHPDRSQERASLLPARLRLRTAGSARQGRSTTTTRRSRATPTPPPRAKRWRGCRRGA